MLEQDRDSHLEVICAPHKELPVEVWMGSIRLAQLPSRESLGDLNRHYVLQRLRHRVLLEMQGRDAPRTESRA